MWRRGVLRAWAVAAAARSGLRMGRCAVRGGVSGRPPGRRRLIASQVWCRVCVLESFIYPGIRYSFFPNPLGPLFTPMPNLQSPNANTVHTTVHAT